MRYMRYLISSFWKSGRNANIYSNAISFDSPPMARTLDSLLPGPGHGSGLFGFGDLSRVQWCDEETEKGDWRVLYTPTRSVPQTLVLRNGDD